MHGRLCVDSISKEQTSMVSSHFDIENEFRFMLLSHSSYCHLIQFIVIVAIHISCSYTRSNEYICNGSWSVSHTKLFKKVYVTYCVRVRIRLIISHYFHCIVYRRKRIKRRGAALCLLCEFVCVCTQQQLN